MSKHDRGAFGNLLAEVKALTARPTMCTIHFEADLLEPDDSEERWEVRVEGFWQRGLGRTGEEALRRLVEKLRVARGESQA